MESKCTSFVNCSDAMIDVMEIVIHGVANRLWQYLKLYLTW